MIPQRNSSTLKVDINDLPSLPFLDGPTMDHSQASSKSMGDDTTPIRRSVTQETKPSTQEEWMQQSMPKPFKTKDKAEQDVLRLRVQIYSRGRNDVLEMKRS